MTSNQLFEEFNIDNNLMLIEQLGRIVTKEQSQRLEQLIRKNVKSGVIDISGWSIEVVHVLLLVCREKRLTITFKNRNQYSTLVRYPEVPMFEIFVKSIMTGK